METLLAVPENGITDSLRDEIERLEDALSLKLKGVESKHEHIEELVQDAKLEAEVDSATASTTVRDFYRENGLKATQRLPLRNHLYQQCPVRNCNDKQCS